MTFFRYAERQTADQLDWSVVGRETDNILNQVIERDRAKKADIEKVSRDYVKQLEEMQMPEDMSLNDWWLDSAATGSQAMRQLNKDLKDRTISYRDYIKRRQNLLDSTSNMQSMVGELQEYFTKAKEAYNSGKADEQTMYEMGLMEGYSKFANTKWVINPTDYSGMLGKVSYNDETGVNDITDIAPISSLRNRLKTIVAPMDFKQKINEGVKVLGTQVNVLRKGGILTREDLTQSKSFNKAADNFINSLLVNPREAGQVLTNYVKINPETNVPYEFTTDEDNKDPNKIKLILDPNNPNSGRLVPELTSAQEKVIKDSLMDELMVQLTKKDTPMPVSTSQTPRTTTSKGKGLTYEQASTNYGGLYKGGDELQAAIDFIKSKGFTSNGERVIDITRTPQKVTFKLENPKDGKVRNFDINFKTADGKDISFDKYLQNIVQLFEGDTKMDRIKDETDVSSVGTGEFRFTSPIAEFNDFVVDPKNDKAKIAFDTIPELSRGFGINNNDANKLSNSIKNILRFFPNKELRESLQYKVEDTSDKGWVVRVSSPQIGMQELEVFSGQKGKGMAQDFVEQIWNALSQQAGEMTPQPTPQPTTQPGTVNYGEK
jgi:hypothetical protein